VNRKAHDKPLVLVVDDDPAVRIEAFFDPERFEVLRCFDCETAVERLPAHQDEPGARPCFAFVDIVLPIRRGNAEMDPRAGLGLMRELGRLWPGIFLVPITGKGWGTETATKRGILDEARAIGIWEYISKPVTRNEVLAVVERALRQQAPAELAEADCGLKRYAVSFDAGEPRFIVSGDKVMQDEVIGRIAMEGPSGTPVLIFGETGTGKELVARAVHQASARRRFLSVNCAAIPDALIESELFGHERGAFSGADGRKAGKFELADGGTIFLDEVGDLSLPAQAKLLRVLQEQEFERVGGTETIRVDVRVVAATNQDLDGMIRQGRFREDLYYRLEGIVIRIPPLRERRDDIPLIARYYLELLNAKHSADCRFAEGALARLLTYHWPGNVRELQNMVNDAFWRGSRSLITAEDLPAKIAARDARQDLRPVIAELARGVVTDPLLSLGVANILIAQEVYRQSAGASEASCKALGISPNTLNKYRRSMDEVSQELIAAGFDEDRAAARLPDFGSATFLRRRIRAFLFAMSDAELVEHQEERGYSGQWLAYMRWVRCLPAEEDGARPPVQPGPEGATR
jgi:DNA-binding NtrC family response regulator